MFANLPTQLHLLLAAPWLKGCQVNKKVSAQAGTGQLVQLEARKARLTEGMMGQNQTQPGPQSETDTFPT
jgi:hypothetical protein